jgi:hypothetical protein
MCSAVKYLSINGRHSRYEVPSTSITEFTTFHYDLTKVAQKNFSAAFAGPCKLFHGIKFGECMAAAMRRRVEIRFTENPYPVRQGHCRAAWVLLVNGRRNHASWDAS